MKHNPAQSEKLARVEDIGEKEEEEDKEEEERKL